MGRLSQTFKICLALLFAVLSTNLLPLYASAYTAPATATDTIDICHANEGVKGYTHNSVRVSSVSNLTTGNGHGTDQGTHDEDIIPPFTNVAGESYPGKNWDETGQATYANDCVVPVVQPEKYLLTSHLVACGQITISLRNVSAWVYPVSYSLDGTTPSASGPNYGPTVDNRTDTNSDGKLDLNGPIKDATASKVINFTEDQNGGSVTVKYVIAAGSENELYKNLPVGEVTTVVVDTDCKEPPVSLVQCESFPLIHATNLNQNGWTLGENASFVDGGIKLDVTGNWDSTAITRTLSGELKDLGTGIDFAPEDQYLGLHVKTSAGTLTYEKFYENQDPANAGKWWSNSNFGVASGQGYATFDTLENIVAANPGVTLENLRVLYTHPNPSSVVVTSVRIGCNEYTFDYERLVQACTVRDNTYRDTWMFDGYTYPEADDYSGVVNNATFQFTNEGLHISTPDKPSYVFGLIDGGNTPLADVDAMSYKTFRKDMSAGYDQTVPAYILYVDTNGDAPNGETYFFYEPYNNGAVVEGTWQTWDAINSGNAKWWMSGTGQKLQSWSYFVGQFPDAVVLAYGFNQGTSNAETYAIIQDMKFDCAITNFAAPQVLGEETTNPTPTGPTVIVPTTGAVLPAQIPATGGDNSNQIAMLVAIIVGGLTYFLVLRRQESYEL